MIYESVIKRKIELTKERKEHVLVRHPDIAPHFSKVSKTLLDPDELRIDKEDRNVLLFYKFFSKIGSGKYLVVVIKLNQRNFILTLYSTYRIRSGEKYELKKST